METHSIGRGSAHPSGGVTSAYTLGLRLRSSYTGSCSGVGSTTDASLLPCCFGAPLGFNLSASLNHPRSSRICHTGPTPMHVPHALPTLRVSNGEDAYAFVGMVSFGAKSIGACRRRSTRSIAAGVDVVEVDAGANVAVVAVGPEKSGTGRWRWWMFGFGRTCWVDVVGIADGALDQ